MTLLKKPKIAILTIRNTYNYGGVLSTLKVVYQFCEFYFEPHVFFLGFDPEISTSLRNLKFSSSVKPLLYFGMHCTEIGSRWAFWEPGHYRFTLPTWKKLLKDYDYFFVVSGTCIAAHPLVQLNKKFAMWIGTPYNEDRSERVKQLSGIRYLLNKLAEKRMCSIEKNIIRSSNFTWAISTYALQKFEKIAGAGVQSIVHCGYPIVSGKLPTIHPQKTDRFILAVGRFSDPRKNFGMLMRTFDRIYQKMPQIKLVIAGMKPEAEKIKPFTSLASFGSVSFTGQVTSDDLKNLYSKAYLLLLTSFQEGLGIVGLEALLYGIPVIATDCGGTKDYAINDFSGYLVDIDDDKAMAERALQILSNPLLHHQVSRNCQQFVLEHFSVQQTHTHFKQGLTATYPELSTWFEECDMYRLGRSRKTAIFFSQEIL